MSDLVRVRASAVASLAKDKAWRSNLYGGLAIGGAVLLAVWTIVTAKTELQYVHGEELDDTFAGIVFFLLIVAALIGVGLSRILHARRLARIARGAELRPDDDWIVVGREVRSTDPTGASGPPSSFKVSAGAREALVRERTS